MINLLHRAAEFEQAVEPGYLCKPYGGRVTRETSSDQYIYVLTGLDRFCKVAGKAERDQASALIAALSRYWLDRGYTRNYFGRPLRWPLNRVHGVRVAERCLYRG